MRSFMISNRQRIILWLSNQGGWDGRASGTNGGKRISYRVLMGKPKERNHVEDLGVDERIIY
jgi:hypothetical protein